jgi:Cd2+/Zn2+-exporting ATPase
MKSADRSNTNEENSIKLEIPLLLPGLEDNRDPLLDRLETALKDRRGLRRVHVVRERDPAELCLHYDPNELSIADVRRLAARAGVQITNRFQHQVLPIEGMDCSDCAMVVEHSLNRIDGVLNARVNYAAQSLLVEYDSRQVNRRAIEKRVNDLGYSVPTSGMRGWYQQRRELIFSLASGLSLLVGWGGEQFLGFPAIISLAFYLLAYILGGFDITRHALGALRARYLDTDLLMVVAALGAASLGEFSEGALLLFLFSLGHALEERSMDRARSAIRSLADLVPKTALIRRDGKEIERPIDEIPIGETVIIRPGVRVPVDGVVLQGRSSVNQAPVTGESIPVQMEAGSQIYAGSINGEGVLEVHVNKLGRDSTLARVVRMVERAQAQKAPIQQATERFTRLFVPAVLLGDLLLIVIPLMFGLPFHETFRRAMTLLVAASPCALALGTPAAVLSGIAHGARNGVLFKGGVHLANLGGVKILAFDKTGTLTRGTPEVGEVISLRPDLSVERVLQLAAAVEGRSAHPLAKAVWRAAQDRGLQIPEVTEAYSITGRGAAGKFAGKLIEVGNLRVAGLEALEVPLQKRIVALEETGKTVLVVLEDGQIAGLISIGDELRPEARGAIAALRKTGISKIVMLTGDNPRTAAYISEKAGVDAFSAGLLPEQKGEIIQSLLEEYATVAMVGDGVNDAPALAAATVGIAMGGASTDVALETANVALMADDLSKLPFAIGLGKASRAIINQNLAIAGGVILGLVFLTLTGATGMGIAILLHEGSTIAVVLNALRLLAYPVDVVV